MEREPMPMGFLTAGGLAEATAEAERINRAKHRTRLGRLIFRPRLPFIVGERDEWTRRIPIYPRGHYILAPDSALPIPKSVTDRIDPEAAMAGWQRRTDNGEFLKPWEPGYEEAQERFATERAEFAGRFPETAKILGDLENYS